MRRTLLMGLIAAAMAGACAEPDPYVPPDAPVASPMDTRASPECASADAPGMDAAVTGDLPTDASIPTPDSPARPADTAADVVQPDAYPADTTPSCTGVTCGDGRCRRGCETPMSCAQDCGKLMFQG